MAICTGSRMIRTGTRCIELGRFAAASDAASVAGTNSQPVGDAVTVAGRSCPGKTARDAHRRTAQGRYCVPVSVLFQQRSALEQERVLAIPLAAEQQVGAAPQADVCVVIVMMLGVERAEHHPLMPPHDPSVP